MSDDNGNWDFKLDEEVAPRKKKSTGKPLLKNAKKEGKLGLDESSVPARKSRRQLAKEEGGTSIKGRDIIDPAAHWRRGLAFSVDLVILILIVALGQGASVMFSDFGQSIKEFLGPEMVNTIPLDVGGVVIAFAIHFLLIIVPMASSQKSIGKKIFKLKILGTLKPKAPLGVIVIREYIAKPISIISVIGILMIPLNMRRRGLHDFISGTLVLDNL